MGFRGMGIAQSDEYCEVYDNFMKEYCNGKKIIDITAGILDEYHRKFDDNDGVMHDVYFALAKAEWMCCAQSELVISKVRNIISSGENAEFYRELGATESDLKSRRKNLDSFWLSLQTPRKNPRRKHIDPLDRVKELPPVEIGGCYAYKHENGFRILVILDRKKLDGWNETVFCAILENTFSKAEIDNIDYSNETIGIVACYVGVEFLGKSLIKKVASIDIPNNLQEQILGTNRIIIENKKSFHKQFDRNAGRTLAALFLTNKLNCLIKLQLPKIALCIVSIIQSNAKQRMQALIRCLHFSL